MGMKKTKLALTLLFLFLCTGSAFAQPKAPNLEYVRGDVLVLLEAPGGASGVESQAETIAEATGSRVMNTYKAIAEATGKSIVRLKAADKSADELLSEVRRIPGVLGATPNFIVKILRTPNDPEFPSAWGMPRVKAPEAWELSTGSGEVYVAVLDTGIKYDHEDLAGNMGRDKDGNFGRNLVGNNADPMDDNGHGTHLAGIIGAVGDNAVGTAGINWTVRLLGVKVLDGNGAASFAHVIAGLDYVLDQKKRGLNVRVANMAFGGWTPAVAEQDVDPLAVACKAVADAGVLLVAAAGNEGQNIAAAGGGYKGNAIYPAAFSFPEMVTVAAVAKNGALARFSNFGPAVDLAAPGFEVPSTTLDGAYGLLNGTSAAAAHVAGAAALLAAHASDLTAAQLKERLLEYAEPHQTLSGKVTSGGSLNAGAALKNERGTLKVSIAGPASARWSLNGKGSYPNGHILTGLPVGKYTVSFSDADLWTKPANIAVTVTADAETAATGIYRQQNASLWVTIEGPEEARWTLNKKDMYENDRTLGKLAGRRTVSFAEVPGWDTPAVQSVTVPRNAPLAVTGAYKRQTGSVAVTFEGPAEARWSIDGDGAYASGDTVENVPVGNRTIRFSGVPHWDTPEEIVVLVAKGALVEAKGAYVHQVGSIKVSIDGPKEASWTVNGRGLYATGDTASNIPVGAHTVSFSAVHNWDNPAPVAVTVERDAVLEIARAYARHLGSVSVTLNGPAGARWSLEGVDGLLESGAVRADLPVGEYTVVFSDVQDWSTPERVKVSVVKDTATREEAAYAEHRGSVSVEIAGPAEARWSLDGMGSYASGETVKDVVVGKHTVSFSEIPNWDKPADLTVEVAKDAVSAAKGAYAQHKGSVQVTIDGPAGARWSLNGEGSYKDGETVKDLVVGEYTVSFFDLADWDEPAAQNVSVTKDAVSKLDVAFAQHKGSVQVVFSGPEEARWSLSGKGNYASGETIRDVVVGTYTLSFSQMKDWDAPQDLLITVAKDSLAKAEPAYKRHLGSVKATIDGPAEARWSLNGEGSYESGQTVDKVAVGEHTVSFSEVVDWDKPGDMTVTVTKDALSAVDGSYVQHKGAVQVTFEGPADARWSLSGEGSYTSGEVVAGLVVGEYTLSFSKMAGWDRPGDQKLVVGKDMTATFEGTYTQHIGTVAVHIEGPSEAFWQIAGIEGTHASGDAAKALPVGEYVVSFSAVDGWDAPADQSVTVFRNVTAMATGAYARHTGSVSAVIEGPETALWSLNGEGSHASGEVLQGLPAGEYVVSFSAIEGWDAPENQTVTVTKGELGSISAVYVQHTGSVSAVIEGPETALWSLNGEGSHASGEVVRSLPVGDHVVAFAPVAGWDAPERKTVAVTKDELASVSAVYVQQTGSVSAVIEGPGNALWSLNGEGRHASGEVVQGLPVGEYVVSFAVVEGWDTPAEVTVSVAKDALSSVSAVYVQQTGSVSAVIDGPETALWSLNGEGSYASGEVVQGLPVGDHVVAFAPVAGWDAPERKTVAVTKDELASVSAVYVQQTGSVSAVIEGPENALWSLNGEGRHASGEVVQSLPVGEYVVSFAVVEGWDTPAEVTVSVAKDVLSSATGVYVQHAVEEPVKEEPAATEEPKAEEPTVEEVKEEAATEAPAATEEPKAEEPAVEEVKEEAATEAPAATEEPKAEGPAVEEVKEEAKTEEPAAAEEPKAEGPAVEEVKEEAATEAPAATEEPKAEGPAVEEVKEEAKTEESAAAEEPKAEEPAVEEVKEEAATEAPAATEEPKAEGPAVEEVKEEAKTEESAAAEEPKAEEPAVEEVKEEAATETPAATEEPKAEGPAVEEVKEEAKTEESAAAEEPKAEERAVEEVKEEAVTEAPAATEEPKAEESVVEKTEEAVTEVVGDQAAKAEEAAQEVALEVVEAVKEKVEEVKEAVSEEPAVEEMKEEVATGEPAAVEEPKADEPETTAEALPEAPSPQNPAPTSAPGETLTERPSAGSTAAPCD